ncbi:MAG: hypothetical protein DRP63_02630 [Planctomycetota bacterium]|nr:MAG: hypothetical protein DRP63_02630 [Planctomycetota bacterium]
MSDSVRAAADCEAGDDSGAKAILHLLDIVSRQIAHHHDALWQEEKHYTWWVYIVFAALLAIFLQVKDPLAMYSLLCAVSAFGMIVSLVGYAVIRKEGEHFWKAMGKRNELMDLLRKDEPKLPSVWGLYINRMKDANKSLIDLLRSVLISRDAGIRDYFQFVFIVCAICAGIISLFSLRALIRVALQ